MARYWGAFVIHGEPGASGLPAWPRFNSGENMLNFGEGGKVETMSSEAYATEHDCSFWNPLADDPYPMQ